MDTGIVAGTVTWPLTAVRHMVEVPLSLRIDGLTTPTTSDDSFVDEGAILVLQCLMISTVSLCFVRTSSRVSF